MYLSHSKLSCILSCPMTYYLKYVQGIYKKVEKTALSIGSAVHWGIEHNTDDLADYFKENGTWKQQIEKSPEEHLASAMVYGYLKHKDEMMADILTDFDTGEQLEVLTDEGSEEHELKIYAKLKSFRYNEPHKFVGIIDRLVLTNKGFIVIDYKTSTYEPHWEDYLDQLYRYVFELKSEFPEVPVYKLVIINIRKTGIRQKKNEDDAQFRIRQRQEYDINDENLVNYHIYDKRDLDDNIIDQYINNLSKQADTAALIDEQKRWFINYGAANGSYGKSDYWDIFYHVKDAYLSYGISDMIYNSKTKQFDKNRDCVDIDMELIDRNDVLNKYERFRAQALAWYSVKSDIDKDEFFEHLKANFRTNDTLLELYWTTLGQEVQN